MFWSGCNVSFELMERDALDAPAREWWDSLTRDQKKRVAHQNSMHIDFKQFSNSQRLITRAYLKSLKK